MTKTAMRCATCAEPVPGRYCAKCGEKRLGIDDHRLKHIIGHAFEAATNANGKALLTLRMLLRHPGTLTAAHIRGERKPYLPPLQLFLLANLVFFLLHPLIGSNTLTTSLHAQLHYTWHARIAEALVVPRLQRRAISAEAYAAIFDPASVTQAKSLVILVVPFFAVAVAALYWRRRRSIDHVVFAAHVCAFWLLLLCLVIGVMDVARWLLHFARVFPSAEQVGVAITGTTLAILVGYLFFATRAVYPRGPIWLTVTQAVALGVAFDLSLEAYRCALFFITFWST